jgi:drug/metabolite transporter (DMT)-like permease
VGSAVSCVRVVLIVLGDSRELGLNPYALFVLVSAIATSFYFILQKPMFSRYRAVEVTAYATWPGTVPMLLFLPGLAGAVATTESTSLLAAVYLGVFPSALAYTLFAFALSLAPITLVTAYLYSIPVFSLLFSWWILGEIPTLLTVIGGVVAIAGIAIVNIAKQRAARRERARLRGA